MAAMREHMAVAAKMAVPGVATKAWREPKSSWRWLIFSIIVVAVAEEGGGVASLVGLKFGCTPTLGKTGGIRVGCNMVGVLESYVIRYQPFSPKTNNLGRSI